MAKLLPLTLGVLAVLSACSALTLPKLKNGGKHWAVLVAGSSGWGNYRHQADVCHAYQVMLDHGVAAENIITMMVDDLAQNEENPTKGIIINRPKGHDVYKGVKIDYRKNQVTPNNFIKVLTGKKGDLDGVGSGRVLESGPDDHVFINFVDHGAPGLVAFPDGELHARKFLAALKSMQAQKKYAQMVIYVEACESGSMFHKLLPTDMNIFATTAANGHESSYAVYFDKERETYLGDVYSVKWMENSDVGNLNKETLAQQFAVVKKETNTSHVQEFGDLKIAQEPVGDFQGNTPSARNVYYPHIALDGVPSHDVDVHILAHKLKSTKDEKKRLVVKGEMEALLKYRDSITYQMERIVQLAVDEVSFATVRTTRQSEINFDCYETLVDTYSHNCQRITANSYALRQLYMLQNICNLPGVDVERVQAAIATVCA